MMQVNHRFQVRSYQNAKRACVHIGSQIWWRHQIEPFSAFLAFGAGNSPVPGEFPSQRPMTWGFDVFFDLCPNKQLSKQSRRWWFETQSHPSWRTCNCNESRKLSLSDDETGISKDKWATMAPCVTRSLLAIVSAMSDDLVQVFHEECFWLPTPFQWCGGKWHKIKCAYMCECESDSSNEFSLTEIKHVGNFPR